ncbi:LysR substrate-binding domain-containing protein [Mesorhizobium sp. M0134]|uniref:LysR substrate-binding domain-containing protein n=1 Tax=Mesorhizobium sp. M0134 TaxID=2956889 RepID=UPI0033364D47
MRNTASDLRHALRAFGDLFPDVETTVQFAMTGALQQALDQGDLDLALMVSQEKKPSGEILLADPLVWSTSMLHNAHQQSPVPVAICEPSNSSSDLVLRSLETSGRAYRIAYVSGSRAGLKLAVTSGLAIAPLYRSDVPPGCRELTVVDGFVYHSMRSGSELSAVVCHVCYTHSKPKQWTILLMFSRSLGYARRDRFFIA